MKRTYLWLIVVSVLVPLLQSCGNKHSNILGPSGNAGPFSGQVSVSVLNGSSPGNGTVVLIQPDGSRQQQVTSNSNAIFQVSQVGSYQVGLASQPSASPSFLSFNMDAAHNSQAIALQLGGAALTIAAAPYQNSWYPFQSVTFNYTLSYLNSSSLQQDIVLGVDPATLPANWLVSFGRSTLSKGQSTNLQVTTADGTNVPVTFVIRGMVGGAVVCSISASLTPNWSLNLALQLGAQNENMTSAPTSTWTWWTGPSIPISAKVSGVNVPSSMVASVSFGAVTGFTPNGNNNCGGNWLDGVSFTPSFNAALVPVNLTSWTPLGTLTSNWFNTGWNLNSILKANQGCLITYYVMNYQVGSSSTVYKQNGTIQWSYY